MAKTGERKLQILQTLATMLENPKGEKITTAALAARLDCSEAALYRHFASKAQMFEGLIEFIESSLFSVINQIATEETRGLQQVEHILALLLGFAQRNRGMTKVLTGDALVNENERLQARINQLLERVEAALKQALRIAATQQQVSAAADFGALANLLLCYTMGRWQQYVKSGFTREPLANWPQQWMLLCVTCLGQSASQATAISETPAPELQQLEYKAILDNAGVAIIFTRDRQVYRCNPHAEALFGWPPGTLSGQPGDVFYADAQAYEAMGQMAGPLLSAGQTVELETPLARRNGSTFTAHLIARALDPDVSRAGTIWIVRDISSEVASRDSNARMLREHALIFDRVQTGILFVRERIVLRCNPRFEEIFGYPQGALVGLSTRVLFPDDASWTATADRIYSAIHATGFFDGPIHYCRRDGTAICCHVSGRMIDDSNADAGYVWLYEDITAQQAAEESLRRSHREYSLIFENAMIGISYIRDRVFLRCNRRLEEMFGFPPGGLVGQSSRMLFSSDKEWEEVGQMVQTSRNKEGAFSGEILYRKRDGTPIHVLANGIEVQDGDKKIWVWTHQDITREHLAEAALHQSHAELEQRVAERTAELSRQLDFLQQLLEAIPGPVFYKDVQSRYLGCNSAFADFIGIPAKDLVGKAPHDVAPAELADKYLAADRALFAAPGSQIYESPARYANGEIRDILFHKATFTRDNGEVGGIVGFMLDISERKRMEERLQQAATAFDSSAEGITFTAPDGSIMAVNRAFTEITGYTPEEVIGRNPRFLQSGRQDAKFYQEMWETVGREGRWQGELWNKRKDGSLFPEWLTISAVKDANGRLKHFVGVFSDITALKKAHERLDYQAHHDPLTGLPNRLLLEDRLLMGLQRARREQSGLAVLFVDLDRFKNINDTLGHHVGDQVLCAIAARFCSIMRESDTVARLGGDEFLMIIEGVDNPSAISLIADKILEDLRQLPVTVEQEFFVGASIGISLFPRDGDDAATLIKHADIAMYRAKERGRNTYEFFTSELTLFSLERLKLETTLRRAIERDELRVFLQPQFSLRDGTLVGAEALVRWRHPEFGLLAPGKFIPLAEESGLIVAMGEWVQQTACRYWAEWTEEGLAPGILSVNVSGAEFRRGRILDTVRKVLAASRLAPQLLELEITETAIMSQAEKSIEVLHELRALGVALAIDDFGTGYSSLAYLKRLPLNKLKVDQSFVRGLPTDAEDCAIARAVIALGHSLQLTVIAEGVELEQQRRFLAQEGCDEMQGFLCGKPVPVDEFRRTFLAR